MKQELKKLNIVSYDKNNESHRKFKSTLLNDEDFKKYFGQFFIKNADEIFSESNKLEVNKAYLVMDDALIIGFLRIFSYHEAGFINIQYAVNPEYRKQGYGKLMLNEVSNFLLNNNIKCISLDIDKNNLGSIKCALENGYIKEDDKYKLRK